MTPKQHALIIALLLILLTIAAPKLVLALLLIGVAITVGWGILILATRAK